MMFCRSLGKEYSPLDMKNLNLVIDDIINGTQALDFTFTDFMYKSLGKDNIHEKLSTAQTYLEKVLIVENCFSPFEFRKRIQNLDSSTQKCEAISETLLNRADRLLKASETKRALRCCNLALMHSPAYIMGNIFAIHLKRSEILTILGKFEAALKDIELIYTIRNYPEQFDEELWDRKHKCLSAIISKTIDPEDPSRKKYVENVISKVYERTVPGPGDYEKPSKKLVTVKTDENRGRHFIFNEDLLPGTTVIVDEPFVSVLVDHLKCQTKRCNYCHMKVFNPIVCGNCIMTIYCSEECLFIDNGNGHLYECPLLQFLHCVRVPQNMHLAIKAICKTGPETIKYLFWKTETSEEDESCSLYVDQTKLKSYQEILNLVSHSRPLDIPFYGWLAVSLAYLLRMKTEFFIDVPTCKILDLERFVASLLLRHCESFPYNTMGMGFQPKIRKLQDYLKSNIGEREIQIASGIFPSINLINHSCVPNTFRVTLSDRKIAIVTNRKVKAGEELTMAYGYVFMFDSLEDRRNILSEYYNFLCDCVACTEEWPLFKIQKKKPPMKFLCPSCNQNSFSLSMNVPCLQITNGGKCNQCNEKKGLSGFMLEEEKFSGILDKVEELHFKNKPLEAIPQIIKCINFYQMKVNQPSWQMILAQTRLKESYDLLLNMDEIPREEKKKESKKKSCNLV